MGRQIVRGSMFLGVPLVRARNLLVAMTEYYWNATVIAGLSRVRLDIQTTAMLMQEFKDRGLFDWDERGLRWELNPSGIALATASGMPRARRDRAEAVLAELLASAADLNANPDMPYHVDRIWLYGSMLGDSEDVGDVDVVVTKKWSPEYERLEATERGKRADAYARRRVPLHRRNTVVGSVYVAHTLFSTSLFGRKNPLLSPGAEDELIAMAVPCRLIFDAARGGSVDDPVLPKHPLATERAERIGAPPAMPDLSARGAPGLVEAAMISSLSMEHDKVGEASFLPEECNGTTELYRRIDTTHVLSSEKDLDWRIVPPRNLNALLNHFPEGGYVAVTGKEEEEERLSVEFAMPVTRSLERDPDAMRYLVELAPSPARPSRFSAAQAHVCLIPVLLLAGADIQRQLRSAAETGGPSRARVEFRVRGETPAAAATAMLLERMLEAHWTGTLPDGVVVETAVRSGEPGGIPAVTKRLAKEIDEMLADRYRFGRRRA